MSEMQWQTLPLGQLRPAAYNPRKALKPSDKEYQKIKNSIQEFGYVEPIIVNYDMTVIGGHQRLTVLKDLGYTEAQCVVLHIEDEAKVKAVWASEIEPFPIRVTTRRFPTMKHYGDIGGLELALLF